MSDRGQKQPERMDCFFDVRANHYDEHMRSSIVLFEEFYSSVAVPLISTDKPVEVLNLGCGTGLELEYVLQELPNAHITCVDLSAEMLAGLERKYRHCREQLRIVQASYLELPLGDGDYRRAYDYVLSVMTMHHLLPETKQGLYKRICRSLKPVGKYIEGDYVVSRKRERELLAAFQRKYAAIDAAREGSYHIDIPFCLDTQVELLLGAGFSEVDIAWHGHEAAVMVAFVA